MAAVAAVTNVLWGCSVNFSWQIPQCGVRANLCIDVVQSLAGAALAFSSFVDAGPAEHIHIWGRLGFVSQPIFAEIGPNRFLKKHPSNEKHFRACNILDYCFDVLDCLDYI